MTDKSIFCTSCGATNHPEARFCFQCGAAILKVVAGDSAAPKNETPAPASTVMANPSTAPKKTSPSASSTKKPKVRLFSTGEIIAGLACTVVLYLVLTITGIVFFTKAGIRPDNIVQKIQAAIQERALSDALARFDTYQSFTRHTVTVFAYPDDISLDDMVMDLEEKVNQTNNISLTAETVAANDYSLQLLCTSEDSYATDATGLMKPSQYECEVYQPRIPYLNLALAEIQASEFRYLGEEMLESGETKKYELLFTEEQLNDPALDFTVTNPVAYFYVGIADGNLLRMEYSIESLETSSGFQYSVQETIDFYDWDATSFTVPEYVDRQDTGTQTFAGGLANTLSFDYPRPYAVNGVDVVNYLSLSTPAGGRMYFFSAESEMDSLGDFQYAAMADYELEMDYTCDEFGQNYIMGWTGYMYSQNELVSYARIQGNELNFCQAIIDTEDGTKVYYYFAEPLSIADHYGRFMPLVYMIEVTPGENEDPGTIFLDVIKSIRLE